MKKCIVLCLAALFAWVAHAQEGEFHFKIATSPMVLNVYSAISSKQLVIESGVTNQTRFITVETTKGATKEDALKMLESALRELADVVFEPLDGKRVTVNLVKK